MLKKNLIEMAISRSGFKTRAQEYIAGAFLEFVTARVFQYNGESLYVVHKNREVHDLLQRLSVMQFLTKTGNWAARRAATEAAEELMVKYKGFVKTAENSMPRYFGRKSKKISQDQMVAWRNEFNSMVQDILSSFVL